MHYGICTLSVVPGRREPSGTSEMVTQLLFGEHYRILEQREEWSRIKTALDHYECWISNKQLTKIHETTYHQLQKNEPVYSADLVQSLLNKNSGNSFLITIGSILPHIKNQDFSIENHTFHFDGTTSAAKKNNGQNILNTAQRFLDAPYLWGGKTPFGIDCSGFTQMVFRLNGYQLPRDAYQQVESGHPLSFVEEAEPGDLAFFDNEEGKIVHVGILLNNQQIIHASGYVRIDKFDHYGIYNTEKKGYSHTLRVIKRVL
jgi:gamma-D-glutamyl-L-lysine dipeptidyl-peptidase